MARHIVHERSMIESVKSDARLFLPKLPPNPQIKHCLTHHMERMGAYCHLRFLALLLGPYSLTEIIMDYTALFTELGKETGLDVSASTQSGSCTIEFGTGNISRPLEVSFEAADEDGVPRTMLHMHAVIGTVPLLGAETLLMRLMQLHVLGIATAQGMFGYEPAMRNIVFFRSILLAPLTHMDAIKAIEAFVNQAERWRDHLPTLSAPETPPASRPNFLMTA